MILENLLRPHSTVIVLINILDWVKSGCFFCRRCCLHNFGTTGVLVICRLIPNDLSFILSKKQFGWVLERKSEVENGAKNVVVDRFSKCTKCTTSTVVKRFPFRPSLSLWHKSKSQGVESGEWRGADSRFHGSVFRRGVIMEEPVGCAPKICPFVPNTLRESFQNFQSKLTVWPMGNKIALYWCST